MIRKDNDSISKRMLWHYVNKKINRTIHHSHVLSIISILFEEIIEDLKAGKELNIHNFGKLSLNQTKPRVYYNVVYQKLMLSKGRKILKFSLSPLVRKKIVNFIDIDKTFGGD